MPYTESTVSSFPVTVESWGWSHRGDTRPDNQDAFLSWTERLLWMVADGVASSGHGGEASRDIARALSRAPHARSLNEHVDNVLELLHQTHAELYARSQAGQYASTVVTLLMHGNEAACLWGGDSPCYMLRDGVLYQCTREHTLRQKKIDHGELTAPEARRMIRGNIITNALGVGAELHLDQVRFSLRGGDRFLLCTDGLTGLLGPEALAGCLRRTTARECAEYLAQRIKDLPQPDNITFVVVFLSLLDRS